MATAVFFHAHPDDEAIATGGTMAKAAKDGHRVVLVVATKGEHGEVAENYLEPDELLWHRREREQRDAAKILGVDRLEFLGYVDSGMIDTPENTAPECFWQADVEEAAERLAAILRDEHADLLTVYDSNGNYGHPDHIQVHRVGLRAAELAGTPSVFQTTINRDHFIRLQQAVAAGEAPEVGVEVPDISETPNFGMPESVITACVDVSAFIELKRDAMRAHASQIGEQSFFLTMPPDAFAYGFGTEWFIRDGQGPGITETELL